MSQSDLLFLSRCAALHRQSCLACSHPSSGGKREPNPFIFISGTGFSAEPSRQARVPKRALTLNQPKSASVPAPRRLGPAGLSSAWVPTANGKQVNARLVFWAWPLQAAASEGGTNASFVLERTRTLQSADLRSISVRARAMCLHSLSFRFHL